MGKFSFFRLLSCVAFLSLFALTGCGGGVGGATVSGTVSFNGQPVEHGNIDFTPVDGKGRPAGAEIKGGKYTANGVTPGKNKVVVSAYTKGDAGGSMDDAIKAAKAAAKKAPTGDVLTANSEGNSQPHDIADGSSTLDLTLKTKISSDGKVQ